MPTSSFTKDIKFNAETARRFARFQEQQGVKLPHPDVNRVEEGKRTLMQFSPQYNNKKQR